MGRSKDGIETRARLAATLLELATERNLGTVKIRDVTERAGVDRQTLYYHFEDIYDLAGYTYRLNIAHVLGYESMDEAWPFYTSAFCTRIMWALEGGVPGLSELVLFMHGQNPHGYFFKVVRRNIFAEASNALRLRGVPENMLDLLLEVETAAHVAIIIGWLKGEYRCSYQEMDTLLNRKTLAIMTAFRID